MHILLANLSFLLLHGDAGWWDEVILFGSVGGVLGILIIASRVSAHRRKRRNAAKGQEPDQDGDLSLD